MILASRSCGRTTILSALPILTLLFASVASMTETNGVLFLFPTQGVTLHYNDYVQVQYTSNFTAPWLFTFCRDADGNVGEKQHQGVGGGNNTATVKLNWSGSDTPCWFDLKPNSSAAVGAGANSDNWSFDVSQRAATTVGLDSPSGSSTQSTSTPTATSSSSSTTAAAAAATGKNSAASSGSGGGGGLSTGAQAGIGIAAAIAGICVGAVAVFVYMRRRKQRARKEAQAAIETRQPGHNGGWSDPQGGEEEAKYHSNFVNTTPHQRMPVAEIDGHSPAAHEMYAG